MFITTHVPLACLRYGYTSNWFFCHRHDIHNQPITTVFHIFKLNLVIVNAVFRTILLSWSIELFQIQFRSIKFDKKTIPPRRLIQLGIWEENIRGTGKSSKEYYTSCLEEVVEVHCFSFMCLCVLCCFSSSFLSSLSVFRPSIPIFSSLKLLSYLTQASPEPVMNVIIQWFCVRSVGFVVPLLPCNCKAFVIP